MQYHVIRGKRKTLSLGINREGEIVVRAPNSVRDDEIADFVYRHRAWIAKQLTLRNRHPHFYDGDAVSLLGKQYVIAPGTRIRMAGDTLYLPQENREAALAALLKRLTRDRMKRLLDEIANREGFVYTKLTVTSSRGRWGSCGASRRISFSFRTAFLPDPLARYLAVHELCHTRHMNHGDKFWAEVERILPDYRALRDALKGYLWVMDCL